MAPRFKFETKLLAAYSLAMLAVVALAASAWHAAREIHHAAYWVTHTHEVLDQLADAKSNTLLVEFNAQNFRLTEDPAYIVARDAAIAAREISLRRIKDLTADNPRQQERWAQLRATVDERMAIARKNELLRRTEGTEAARAHAAGAPLRETRERVFSLLHAMGEEERHLLQKRNAELTEAREARTELSAITSLLLLALLAATYVMIRRQLFARACAEAALRESEESLATTLHSIGDAVLATDADGRIVRMNPVAERLTGWLLAEARGRPVDEVFRIVNEQTCAPADLPVAKVLATGKVQGLANHSILIARDGTEWPVADSAAPIRDAEDRVSGVVLVFRDVTEERATEKLIREQNELLEKRVGERTAALHREQEFIKALLQNVAVGVVACDANGKLVLFNQTACEWHGMNALALPPEEWTRHYDLFEADGQTPLPTASIPLLRAFRGETVRDIGMAIVAKGHAPRFVLASGTPFHDADGSALGAVVIMHDITARKRAEEEILDLNASLEQRVVERTRQLEEANRAKSDFLANMSHELRTPLNSIIGFSEMLKDGVLGELEAKQRGFVADIFDAGTHLLSLINDILDLSKVEAGMLELEAGAVDIRALLQSSLLVVREKALAHRIRLDTRLDPALGATLADERKLKQIVYNLLSNAVKFTPEGGAVTLAAHRCARSEVTFGDTMPARLLALPPGDDAEFLAIEVEDGGVGIAEADLGKLFEPFTQVDSSAARRHAGTGLGLSLVRRLAELHGGTVGVASRPGIGSRFCVWLPWRAAALTQGAPASEAPAAAWRAAPLALVIEDDDHMADLITAQLRAEGFRLMRAATAEEGLVRATKSKPDLITLEIFLPAMDGWEFMRRLRTNPTLADIPVVIITASEDMRRGLALGARRVLQKPFAREELVAALAGLIKTRADGEAPCLLVVDDNVKAVELVATMLQAEGYRVLCAYGGTEAIEVARRDLPDLVILDLIMPEVSGFEVARALRDAEQTARIPILVLTAKDLTAEDHARLSNNASAIMAKADFNRSALLTELHRALPRPAGD